MAGRDCLTSERLNQRFNSSFELVNYAIKLAQDLILTGRACRVDTPIQNKAYQVLSEIMENKDMLSYESFEEEDDEEEETE